MDLITTQQLARLRECDESVARKLLLRLEREGRGVVRVRSRRGRPRLVIPRSAFEAWRGWPLQREEIARVA